MKYKDFENMKQSDRIEYLLLNSRLDFSLCTLGVMWNFITILLGYFAFSILVFLQNEQIGLKVLELIPTFIFLFRCVIVVCVPLDIAQITFFILRKRKLNRRFLNGSKHNS